MTDTPPTGTHAAPTTEQILEVLTEYDIGTIRGWAPAGGTAGKTWKVDTNTGSYFLRLRGVRTSSEARLSFDHGLRDHLVAHGIPTAASIRARNGNRWHRHPGGVYELYPFVAGYAFHPETMDQVAAAARALARYHRVAAGFVPPENPERIAQYTTLGFSDRTSDRMDDPLLLLENLEGVAGLASGAGTGTQALIRRCMARVEDMNRDYAGPAYDRLSGWIIHGDYTPANVLFSAAGEVAGIFDLDWAFPGPRCRDVADGLFFFATVPRQIDAGCIWSLTAAAAFDPERCRVFLQAYQKTAPLQRPELRAVPAAFAGRWLSIRLEGMAKVDPSRRVEFFSRDVEAPMQWLDRHWPDLGGV